MRSAYETFVAFVAMLAILFVALLPLLLWLVFWGTVVFIAWHFVGKYW